MAIKILLITLLSVAAAAATSCCRGYKILQLRRPGMLSMYDAPSHCGGMYDHHEDYCDGPFYPKYDAPESRYYPPYAEPKTITHKCVCSKSVASQRMVTTVPRYYKRGYCSDSLVDAHYPCGQYPDCPHYGHCAMSSSLFRQAPSRVLPLTLPASCVC